MKALILGGVLSTAMILPSSGIALELADLNKVTAEFVKTSYIYGTTVEWSELPNLKVEYLYNDPSNPMVIVISAKTLSHTLTRKELAMSVAYLIVTKYSKETDPKVLNKYAKILVDSLNLD